MTGRRQSLRAARIDNEHNDREPIRSRSRGRMINDTPFQYHNYQKLMSGTCHLQYRSKLGLLRVIARLALECIWADRIDGRKTQRSVIGGHCFIDLPPQSEVAAPNNNKKKKISCRGVKNVKKKTNQTLLLRR